MASPLALAAGSSQNPFGLPGMANASNPFGLSGNSSAGIGSTMSNPDGPVNPPVSAQQKTPTQNSVIPMPQTQATTTGAAGAPTPTAGQFTFDLKTDPALQQVNALTGLSDQQAQAQALKEREQQLLAYGDPRLAAAILGKNDPTVQAAAQNQESTLSQLSRDNANNLKGFETQLDPSLAFSGYKVGQEQQIGQNYQDALAKAALGVQGNLDQITSNLNAALSQNNAQRESALEQAYQNALALIQAGLGPAAAGATDPAGFAQMNHGLAGWQPPSQAAIKASLGARSAATGGHLDPAIADWLLAHSGH